MTSFKLAFSSQRARFQLTRSARLLAKTWAYELVACSAEAVCPACSLAAGSVQRVSAWISRALFSLMNAGHSLLVAGCAPSQFGHLTDSLFGQSSCLWPVPEHNGHTFSVAWQVHAPWPNCWQLKQRLGRGKYGVTSNLSKPRKMCSGRVGGVEAQEECSSLYLLASLGNDYPADFFHLRRVIVVPGHVEVSGKFLIRQAFCSLFEPDYTLGIVARPMSFGVCKSASGLSFGVEGEHGGDDKLTLAKVKVK